uniref:Phosphoinositide phospholipase C n=1 Tax=Eptatretus burgeri TaxID=7764 RepID=A0A8C4N620_EPTBU
MATSKDLKPSQESEVERCLSLMQAGSAMTKLKGSPRGLPRVYFLDRQRSAVCWRPSRKQDRAKISIDSVREVCEGRESEAFQRMECSSLDLACCLSVYHGTGLEPLALVASSPQEAQVWLTGLHFLMAGILGEDCLAKRQRTRDRWLQQTFEEADKNGDGSLSIEEVLHLMHKLNVNLPRRKVKRLFKEADTDTVQGSLNFEEFCALYKSISTRRDLYLLLFRYSNRQEHLTFEQLKCFLQTEQQMHDVSEEHCRSIVENFEPCKENKVRDVLGIDGFTNYMRSPEGDIFNQSHLKQNQDMNRPLSQYFIASSHNTYLTGDQLMSQSRAEMYAWVLQAGCRCVEVDCWDGPDGEPVVYHGHTLTSKILFRDVIETINKHAFVCSRYPVILSIENHCSVEQQRRMAYEMQEILEDKLDLSSVLDGDPSTLPSPESLIRKVLIKGKKLPSNLGEDTEDGEVSEEDSAEEIEGACKLMNGDTSSPDRRLVESFARRRLEILRKERKFRKSDDSSGSDSSLRASSSSPTSSDRLSAGDGADQRTISKRSSFIRTFRRDKRKNTKTKSKQEETSGQQEGSDSPRAGAPAPSRGSPRRGTKRLPLCRALSDLVQYTRSVALHDLRPDDTSSWQVTSLSESKANQLQQQRAEAFLHFNRRQLSRVYPSSLRVDSSNFSPHLYWSLGCQLVALNYQTSGRMMELNRALFATNGNCGYVLKPDCLGEEGFNPLSEEVLQERLHTELAVKVISGQQLPKPPDSVLGDRGEIIDPFVEVEVVGVPIDCRKQQTRVIDDNGFNPVWDETLVFHLHVPELALIRFLVWDHDPIGRDFIGQRTVSFRSIMTGYRHVYLEGFEEASIFVHISSKHISGKVKQTGGLKMLFSRPARPSSLDNSKNPTSRRHSISRDSLRRTASVPATGRHSKAQSVNFEPLRMPADITGDSPQTIVSRSNNQSRGRVSLCSARSSTTLHVPIFSSTSSTEDQAADEAHASPSSHSATSACSSASTKWPGECTSPPLCHAIHASKLRINACETQRNRKHFNIIGTEDSDIGWILDGLSDCIIANDHTSGLYNNEELHNGYTYDGDILNNAVYLESNKNHPSSISDNSCSQDEDKTQINIQALEKIPFGPIGRDDISIPLCSMNVTTGERLWEPLGTSAERNSVASTSSISSTDTVIDLSQDDRASLQVLVEWPFKKTAVGSCNKSDHYVLSRSRCEKMARELIREDKLNEELFNPVSNDGGDDLGPTCFENGKASHAQGSSGGSSLVRRNQTAPNMVAIGAGGLPNPLQQEISRRDVLNHEKDLHANRKNVPQSKQPSPVDEATFKQLTYKTKEFSPTSKAKEFEKQTATGGVGHYTPDSVHHIEGRAKTPLRRCFSNDSSWPMDQPQEIGLTHGRANSGGIFRDGFMDNIQGSWNKQLPLRSFSSGDQILQSNGSVNGSERRERSSAESVTEKQGLPFPESSMNRTSSCSKSTPSNVELLSTDSYREVKVLDGQQCQRCHTVISRPTWSKLYMDSLQQSLACSRVPSKIVQGEKSKSLGDLTSDDIISQFQSRYRRINRGFITKEMREQRRRAVLGQSARQQDPLTQQLVRLLTLAEDDIPEYKVQSSNHQLENSIDLRHQSHSDGTPGAALPCVSKQRLNRVSNHIACLKTQRTRFIENSVSLPSKSPDCCSLENDSPVWTRRPTDISYRPFPYDERVFPEGDRISTRETWTSHIDNGKPSGLGVLDESAEVYFTINL